MRYFWPLVFLLMTFLPSAAQSVPDTVILVHGLGRTDRSFWRVERALRADGYHVVTLNYPSRHQSIETLTRVHLAPLIHAHREAPRLHFVTHSMGGILLRCYLRDQPIANVGRVVMLAPPNAGSEVADRLMSRWFYRKINGPAGQQLGVAGLPSQLGAWPETAGPLGIIAGDVSLNPLFSSWLPGPSDGKVTVRSTRLPGMTDFMVFPSSHTWLAWRQPVIAQIRSFLRAGHFTRPEISTLRVEAAPPT